jgi:hypothetical protein
MNFHHFPKSRCTGTLRALANAITSTSMTVRFPASIRLTSTRVRFSKPPAARRPAKSSCVAGGLSSSLIFLTCSPTTLKPFETARVLCRDGLFGFFNEEFFRRTSIDYRKGSSLEYFGRTLWKSPRDNKFANNNYATSDSRHSYYSVLPQLYAPST